MAEMSSYDDFLGELQEELEKADLVPVKAPLIEKAKAGTLTREEIERWARSFFLSVREAPRAIANDYVNCPDPELRVELAANVYEEETGALSGVENHADSFRRFLKALGVDLEEAERSDLLPPDHAHPISVEDLYDKIALGGLVGEGAFAEIAAALGKAFKENYGFSDEDLTWFTLHGEADKEHGATQLRILKKVAATEAGRQRLRSKLLEHARAYRNALETYRADFKTAHFAGPR